MTMYSAIKNSPGLITITVVLSFGVGISALSEAYHCAIYEVECPGRRPADEHECCPLLPGDNCTEEEGGVCDEELGITCVDGICTGPYDLEVGNVGENFLTVAWSPAKSRNCTVFYSTDLTTQLSLWNSHKVGNASSTTLQQLNAGSLYYIRVSSSTSEGDTEMSETIFAQTYEKKQCLYNGQQIPVGEQIVVDCQESCACAPTGHLRCMPVCTKDDIETSAVCDNETDDDCCHRLEYCLFENCTYVGEHVPHAYSWTIDCAENCTCFDGEVTCVTLCQQQTTIANCSNPVRRKSEDGCCDVISCENTDDQCDYDGVLYQKDAWFSPDDCHICHCSERSDDTNCFSFDRCLSTNLPEESPVCPKPIVAENHCCRQVVCEQQTDPRYLFRMFTLTQHGDYDVMVRFQFLSSTDERNSLSVTLFYTQNNSDVDITSWNNVTLAFDDVNDVINSTSDVERSGLNKIHINYFFIVGELGLNTFYYIRLQIKFKESPFNPKPFMTPPWAVFFPARTQIPDEERYLTDYETSVLSTLKPSAMLSTRRVTPTTVSLTWTIPEPEVTNISSFSLRYKPLGDRDWFLTKRLIFTTMEFKLTCLYPSRWYMVELIAYPTDRLLATKFFNTSSMKETADDRFLLRLSTYKIHSTSVVVQWPSIQLNLQDEIDSLSIFWGYNDEKTNSVKVCIPVDRDTYRLEDLYPNTMYKVWIEVNLVEGSSVLSRKVYFVTSKVETHSNSRHSLSVAIAITCISLVGMGLSIAIALYLLRCKRQHGSYHRNNTTFENKIFQIYGGREEVGL